MASQFLGRGAGTGSRDELYGCEGMTLRFWLGSRPWQSTANHDYDQCGDY